MERQASVELVEVDLPGAGQPRRFERSGSRQTMHPHSISSEHLHSIELDPPDCEVARHPHLREPHHEEAAARLEVVVLRVERRSLQRW